MRVLIIFLFLYGCVPAEIPEPEVYTFANYPIIYIGDSNCDDSLHWVTWSMAWELAGIEADCVGGRQLMQITILPDSEIIFLALGTNDGLSGVSASTYGARLIQLLASTDAKVYCILPILNESVTAFSVDDIRNQMLSICTNTIDPRDYGVIVGLGDGIHWSEQDQINFSPAIEERI